MNWVEEVNKNHKTILEVSPCKGTEYVEVLEKISGIKEPVRWYYTNTGYYIGTKSDVNALYTTLKLTQVQGNSIGRSACIGFQESSQKWFGWSHRARYGFGIGSKITKECCGYFPNNKKSFIEHIIDGFIIDDMENSPYKIILDENSVKGRKGIRVYYFYNDNNKIHNQNRMQNVRPYTHFYEYPQIWGKGEWEAKTLEDAKQMALDFANAVS